MGPTIYDVGLLSERGKHIMKLLPSKTMLLDLASLCVSIWHTTCDHVLWPWGSLEAF